MSLDLNSKFQKFKMVDCHHFENGFLLRDADMHSVYLLRRCGWLAVRHTPVLYQNG